MTFVKQEIRRCVREGYQLLLSAEATLFLPEGDGGAMAEYYQNVARTCLAWAEQIEGERLRASFLSDEDIRARSRFRPWHYSFWMELPWQTSEYLAVVCHSRMEKELRRSAQIWKLSEGTMLRMREIRSLFSSSLGRFGGMTFSPHGIYPKGEELILFRNATPKGPAMEKKLRFFDCREGEGDR